MRRVLVRMAVVGLATSGCVPTMPSQLAEGTEVLAPREVGLTLAGGGGVVGPCCGTSGKATGFGGAEGRLRVGVGAKQEIGVSAFGGVGGDNASSGAIGGKLAYKIAPAPWLAFIANAGSYDYITGGTGTTHTAVFGGDLAAIVAPYTDSRGTQVYTGARGSFVIPVWSGSHGASEALTVPLGVMLKTGELVRVFLEGGFLAGFGQFRSESPPPDNYSGDVTLVGGYGTAAVQFILR